MDKKTLLQFLRSRTLAVLSTASLTGTTESAVMATTIMDNFTILMNTESNTRKVPNILSNPHVSLIIGGLNNDPSVQIDGLAKILDNQESQTAKTYMLTVHPELKDYFAENSKFIAVTPIWSRYSDFAVNPPEIIEFTDFQVEPVSQN